MNDAAALFNKRAQQYQDKYMDLDLYNDTYEFFCGAVSAEHAEILEIACGPGNITRYLLKKRPDFRILGTDLAPNMIELAKANNPQAEFQLLDGRLISKLEKQYNAIVCGFFLPYLSKEEALQFIADASALLKPQGILYLSTMEDDYEKSGIQFSSSGDAVQMYFHQSAYLTEALNENKMKVTQLYRKDFPSQDGTKVTDLVLVSEKL